MIHGFSQLIISKYLIIMRIKNITFIFLISFFLYGCTNTSHLALLSDGDLENKSLEGITQGGMLDGEDCWYQHNLADAFRDAIKDTQFDTLIDVKVITKTNLIVFFNCIQVAGYGVRSSDIKTIGESQ